MLIRSAQNESHIQISLCEQMQNSVLGDYISKPLETVFMDVWLSN
jgi:hypothetical protein